MFLYIFGFRPALLTKQHSGCKQENASEDWSVLTFIDSSFEWMKGARSCNWAPAFSFGLSWGGFWKLLSSSASSPNVFSASGLCDVQVCLHIKQRDVFEFYFTFWCEILPNWGVVSWLTGNSLIPLSIGFCYITSCNKQATVCIFGSKWKPGLTEQTLLASVSLFTLLDWELWVKSVKTCALRWLRCINMIFFFWEMLKKTADDEFVFGNDVRIFLLKLRAPPNVS